MTRSGFRLVTARLGGEGATGWCLEPINVYIAGELLHVQALGNVEEDVIIPVG